MNIWATIPHMLESLCQSHIQMGLGPESKWKTGGVSATELEEKSFHNPEMASVKWGGAS